MSQSRRRVKLFFLIWLGALIFANPAGDIMSDASLSTSVGVVDSRVLELSPHSALDLALVNGKYYCGIAPGSSWVGALVYGLTRNLLNFFASNFSDSIVVGLYSHVLPHKLNPAVYFLQIALVWLVMGPLLALLGVQTAAYISRTKEYPENALLVAATVTLGSMFFPHSAVYSHQALASLLVYNGLFSCLNCQSLGRSRPLIVGAAFGLAIAVDYSSGLLVLLCILFLWPKLSGVSKPFLLLGLGVPLCFVALFHWKLFGSPFLTPYNFRAWMREVLVTTYKGQNVRSDSYQAGRLLGLGYPTLLSLWGLTFSVFRGVFIYNLAMVVGLFGHLRSLFSEGRSRKMSLFAFLVFLSYLLFNSSLKGELYWSGAPQFFGPRYLIPVVPIVILGVGRFKLIKPGHVWIRVLLAGSFIISFLGAMNHDQMILREIDNPFLQNPLLQFFTRFWAHATRVPLLDVYRVSRVLQSLVIMGYLWLLMSFLRSSVADYKEGEAMGTSVVSEVPSSAV